MPINKEMRVLKKIFIFFVVLLLTFDAAFAKVEPNDPGYYYQWYLEKIKAPDSWETTTGSKEVVIAFLDSGVDLDHPDLQKNIWVNMDEIDGDNIDNDKNGFVDDVHGWDFIEENNDPNPKFTQNCVNKDGTVKEKCNLGLNHGTIIAGVAAAIGNNGRGIAGVSWTSKIMPLRVLDGSGYGESSNVVEAVNYAIANKADIINLSLMGDDYSKPLEKALQNAYEAGIIIVAAAGNNDKGGVDIDKYPKYPICYSGKNGEDIILGVVGTDKNDNLAVFSNYGTKCVDVSAPAVDFYGTSVYKPIYKGFESFYSGLWSGTSLATPLVSGLAALIKASKPGLTNKRIYEQIINNTDNVGSKFLGSGRINIYKALGIDKEEEKISSNFILATPHKNKESEIRQFKGDGIYNNSFLAFNSDYTGGVEIASGDVNGDGREEIIVSKMANAEPLIRVFDSVGNMRSEFFAYDSTFKGGVNISAGDLDGDGRDEIIAGAGNTGGPHVRVFDMVGNVKSQFFAYNSNLRGGVNVSSGDVDGDGVSEIITGAGPGGRAHVRIFDMHGNVKSQFFTYAPNFLGGVNISAGDVNGDGKDEIITAPFSKGGSHIRIFDGDGNLKSEFFAYGSNYYGGINITSGDTNNDGIDEIIMNAVNSGNSEVKITNMSGKEKIMFYAFDREFAGGINLNIMHN